MDILNMDKLESNYCYGFGRIAEQYREGEIAIADYKEVRKPQKTWQIPSSSYKLAQNRLAAMKVAK
jgi:hypothetical protein